MTLLEIAYIDFLQQLLDFQTRLLCEAWSAALGQTSSSFFQASGTLL